MEILYLAVSLVQSIGVSLGVGASTIAIASYISASKDGTFDDSERRLMQIVYRILRVGMGIIFVTLILQALILLPVYGLSYFDSPFLGFVWLVVIILFLNAILMTKHRMPMWLGPGLQASTWYTIAVLYFLASMDTVGFSFTQLIGAYLVAIAAATIAVNTIMARNRTRIA